MTREPRILALVPARGGSKRLPGKNVLPLGGKPLIVWSIDVARKVPEICDVLVSTDDPVIADVAKGAGASVPWLRPAELATDSATSVAVALHALDRYETEQGPVDGLLLLQPTSPFRSVESVRRGIALFLAGSRKPVLGVSRRRVHPNLTYRLEDGLLVSASDRAGEQSAYDAAAGDEYIVNGTFYLVTPMHLRTSESFTASRTLPLVIDSLAEGLDIDTGFDFAVARAVAEGGAP